MKIATFENNGEEKIGVIMGDEILDLALAFGSDKGEAAEYFLNMLALIQSGDAGLERARQLVANPDQKALIKLKDVRLKAPLPVPVQLRDFTCFEDHIRQAPAGSYRILKEHTDLKNIPPMPPGGFTVPETWYRQPVYYKGNRFATSHPGDDVLWPSYSKIMDYELEAAIIIGREGKNISKTNAQDYIFGVTIFNDFSARDQQAVDMQGRLGPAKGKDFDGANAFGPWITTMDEIGDIQSLEMVARVNGVEWSRGNTRDMHWSFADLVAYVSDAETIYPGEILGSGTVGNGCGLELGKFLKNGDVVELEIEKIGILKNRVVQL